MKNAFNNKINTTIKLIITSVLAVLFLYTKSVMSNPLKDIYIATPLEGTSKGEFFYPVKQTYIISSVKRIADDIPKDLGGIPYILMNRKIVFAKNYFTFPDVNSGNSSLFGACFSKSDNKLVATPLAPFQRYTEKEVVFDVNDDGSMTFDYGKMFAVTIKKIREDLVEKKDYMQMDAFYEKTITGKERTITQQCEWSDFKRTVYNHSDFTLINSKTGKMLTIKNGNLDLDSLLPNGSSSTQSYSVGENENIVVNGCKAKRISMVKASMSKEYDHFYLLGGLVGLNQQTGKRCSETLWMKKISYEQLSQVLGNKSDDRLTIDPKTVLDQDTMEISINDDIYSLSGLSSDFVLVELIQEK